MKNKVPEILETGRVKKGMWGTDKSYGFNGAFDIKIGSESLHILSSDEAGWDHVSISHERRIPRWTEMCFVVDLFFDDDEVVMQLHPAKKNYINCHPHVLHLWRPQKETIPMPPLFMV